MHASMTAFLPTYIKMETGNLWLAGIALTLFEAAGVVGYIADRIGLNATYLISAALGLIGLPFVLMLPGK